MELENSYAVYLTTLDTMFDTRLTIIRLMFPEFTGRLLDKGNYFTRTKDSYTVDDLTLGYDSFLPIYKRRSKNILRYSNLTFIPLVIGREVTRHKQNNLDGECFKEPKIYVNTYPYILEENEKESITSIFREYCDEEPDVECIYYSPQELTRDVIESLDIDIVIDYHGFEWLSWVVYNNNSPYNFFNSKLGVCVPKIFNSSYSKLNSGEDIDIFSKIEECFERHLEFSFLDAYAFSDRFVQMLKKEESEKENTKVEP